MTCVNKRTSILKLQVVLVLTLLLIINPAIAKSADTKEGTSAFASAIGTRILKEWHCAGDGGVQVILKFNLTKDGDVYHINLTEGFEDPYAIKSALHAVLFSMPLPCSREVAEEDNITCTISGQRSAPTIDITLSPCNKKDMVDELKKVPAAEKYRSQTFIHGPMALRLEGLVNCLYDFPDSPEVRSEIQKLVSFVGLDASVAHDWVGIGRWGNRSIEISALPDLNGMGRWGDGSYKITGNLSQQAQPDMRRSLAAYLQAWRLKHDKNVLYELEDAWTRHTAIEILAISKTDPLLLGNAALLTNQYKIAKEQYELARKADKLEATNLIKQMQGQTAEGELKDLKLGRLFTPLRDKSDWEPLLRWLPLDTELVLFERSSANYVSPLQFSFFQGFSVSNSQKTEGPSAEGKEQETKINGLFTGIGDVTCLHAARTFNVPKGMFWGLGFGDSVDILVLPEDRKQTAFKVMSELRQHSYTKLAIEGIEVLGFDEVPWSFGLSTMGKKKFVCAPYDGVLVAATDLGYLREILLRLRAQPLDRALPASDLEWKFVDTTAKVWAVRNFDQAYVPFDSVGMYDIVTAKFQDKGPKDSEDCGREIGFTFHIRDSTLSIHHLSSNPKTLAGLAKTWPYVLNCNGMEKPGEERLLEGNPKVTIDNDVLTVEGTVQKQNMIVLQLYPAMGYFIAI